MADEEKTENKGTSYNFNVSDVEKIDILREFIAQFGVPKDLFKKDTIKTKGVETGKGETQLFLDKLIAFAERTAKDVESHDRGRFERVRTGLIEKEYRGGSEYYKKWLFGFYERLLKASAGFYAEGKIIDNFDGGMAHSLAEHIVAWDKIDKEKEKIKNRVKGYETAAQRTPQQKQAAEDRIDSLEKMKNEYNEKLSRIAKEARNVIHKQFLVNQSWSDIRETGRKAYKELEGRKEYLTKEQYKKEKEGIDSFFKDVGEGKKKSMDVKWAKYKSGDDFTKASRTDRKAKYEEIYGTKKGRHAGDSAERSEQESKRDEFIRKKRGLKEKLKTDDTYTRKDYKKEMAKLRSEFKPSERSRATHASKVIESKIGPKVMNGIVLAAFIGIGVAATATFGSSWFLFGFMSWGLMYILPHPDDFDIPEKITKQLEDKPLMWSNVLSSGYLRQTHGMWGYLRSMMKMVTYFCFIYGLWQMHELAFVNIALVIISFMAYYSLKIDYDPHKPHELMESLIRFGFLGAMFIPWFIFYALFDSILLGLIAMAFFAIPPIPNDRDKSELFAMYDFYDKILFGIIMVAVLVGYLAGWGGYIGSIGGSGEEAIGSSLNAVFLYFWLISGISGFFSPAMARPGIGFLMMGMATFVYASGPGQQEFFSSLFGPWWPTIQNTISTITTPIGDTFAGIGSTFSSGWLLMTNPVGYATQLMDGSHAQNPQGVTGAHGIEFNSFTVGLIYPNQPFMTNIILRNNGAFEAEGVRLYMSIGGGDAPKKTTIFITEKTNEKTQLPWASTMDVGALKLKNCPEEKTKGLPDGYYLDKNCLYVDNIDKVGEYFFEKKKNGENAVTVRYPTMEKQYVSQYSFEGNIDCDMVNTYDLRKKAIPLRARVIYDYQVDSNVDVSFMSEDEWNRLAIDNKLDAELKFIQSEYSSAPVKFPIGTAGLKNPILATQPFHISLLIDSDMGTKSIIKNVKTIELVYPSDWVPGKSGCTGLMDGKPTVVKDSDGKDTNNMKITFKYTTGTAGAKTIICYFDAIGNTKMSGSPTKTYKVTAHADYTFEMWKDVSTKVEFGGFCCHNSDCPTGYECDNLEDDTPPTYSCSPEGSKQYQIEQVAVPEDEKIETTESLALEGDDVKSTEFGISIRSNKEFTKFDARILETSTGNSVGSGSFVKNPPVKHVYVRTGSNIKLTPSTEYTTRITIYFEDGKTETKEITVKTLASDS